MGIVLIGLVIAGVAWAIYWGVKDAWQDTKEAEKRRIEGWLREIEVLHKQGGDKERIRQLQDAVIKTTNIIGPEALREVTEKLKREGYGK